MGSEGGIQSCESVAGEHDKSDVAAPGGGKGGNHACD